MNKFILIIMLAINTLCFVGCSSTIELSKDDAYWIKEYVIYSNNYIETSFKENPTDAERIAIEPYRARYRITEKIIEKWEEQTK